MIRRKYPLAILLSATLAMGACSSSDSPVADIPDPPEPPAPPTTTSLTVNGFVTDMPIPNATVVLTVNGQDFTAPNPTGADGSYSVVIETTDTDALVECVAFDPDGPARFTALLDNFAGLQESAGVDGILDDANITNVTTAQQLLAEALAADGSIDDLAELQDLAEQVNPQELIELSAAIKIVIDSVQGVVLPEEFSNVQELAQAIVDGTSTFLADVEATNPGIIAETIDEVINDGFATTPFVADSVPGVYLGEDGRDILVLMAGGTGYSAEEEDFGQLIEDVTWSVNEAGALVIGFTEAEDTDTVVLLTDASGVLTVHVSSVEQGEALEPETVSVVRVGFDADGFNAAMVPGSYRDATNTGEGESETEFTVLLEGGSGYDIDVATGVQDDFFTWMVGEDATLTITDDGEPGAGDGESSSEIETIWLLEGSTDNVRNLLIIGRDLSTDEIVEIGALPITYTSEILSGPMPDMANTVLLEGKTYAITGGLDDFEQVIVTFETEGVFSEIYQEYDQQFGPEFGEESSSSWFVDENGVIFITDPATDNDPEETQLVTVMSGLGDDVMVIVVEDDGQFREMALTLVTPFTANDNLDDSSWNVLQGGQPTADTVAFNADGSGAYLAEGIVEDNFDWVIDANGILVNTLDDGPEAEAVFSDNIYRLADSTADNLHVFAVYRANGEVANDSDEPGAPPEVIFEVNLQRQVEQ